jgi:hypothetical protein
MNENIKIDINIIPNGIERENYKYTIALALANDSKESVCISMADLREAGGKIKKWFTSNPLGSPPKIKLFIEDKLIQYHIDEITFKPFMYDVEDEKNGWKSLIDNNGEHTVKLFPFKEVERLLEPEISEVSFTDEESGTDKGIQESNLLTEVQGIENKLDQINEHSKQLINFSPPDGGDGVKKRILSKMDKSDGLNLSANQLFQDMSADNIIDFNDIMSKIFLDSPMGFKRYGLLLDLFVPISEVEKHFEEPMDAKNLKSVKIGFRGSKLMPIIYSDGDQFENFKYDGKTYSKIDEVDGKALFYKQVVGNKTKYYHGRKNFGLIRNSIFDKKITWKNRSRLNSANAKYSSFYNAKTEDSFFGQISKENPNYTRSIIARHNLDIKKFNEIFVVDGIIGHNILVRKTNESNEIKIASLHKYKMNFKLKNEEQELISTEEGYLNLDATNEGAEKEFLSRDLWNWSGKNLTINSLKLDENVADKNISDSDLNEEKRGLSNDEKFESFFLQYGYTSNISPITRSNISLTTESNYSFVIREVSARNGYLFPTESNNLAELTFIDLKQNTQEGFYLNYQQTEYDDKANEAGNRPQKFKLLLDKNPIHSPVVIGKKIYEDLKNPDVQSANHVIVSDNQNSEYRYLYPPQSTLKFYELNGALERNGNEGDEEYKKRIIVLIQKSYHKMPLIDHGNQTIDYLKDPRLSKILVAPGDWKTRRLLNEKVVNEFPLSGNTALTLEISRKIVADTLDLEIKDGTLKMTLPDKFVGELRLHSIADEPNFPPKDNYIDTKSGLKKLRKQSPFSSLSFINLQQKPDIPQLIAAQPLKAKRFPFSDKYLTYIFTDLLVNKDSSRKNLSILSTSKPIIDEVDNYPSQEKLAENKTGYFENEYKPSSFKREIGDIEHNIESEVYPNLFGLTFNLPFSGLEMLNPGDEFCSVRINSQYTVIGIFDGLAEGSYDSPTIPVEPIPEIDPDRLKEEMERLRRSNYLGIALRPLPFERPRVTIVPNSNNSLYKSQSNGYFNHRNDVNNNVLTLTAKGQRAHNFTVVLRNTVTGAETILARKKHNPKRLWDGERPYWQDRLSYQDCDIPSCSILFSYSHHQNGPVLNIFKSKYFDTDDTSEADTEQFDICLESNKPKNFFNIIGVPDTDLNIDYCWLHKDIEEFLLYNKNNYAFGLNHFKSMTESKFEISNDEQSAFLFRDEKDTKYKTKHFRLRAVSRFENNSQQSLEKYVSKSKDDYELTVENIKKPAKPNIRITPILHQFEEKFASGNKSKQFYRLMVEIERPWSEDQLVLILNQVNQVNQEKENGHSSLEVKSKIGKDNTKPFSRVVETNNKSVAEHLIFEAKESVDYYGKQQYLNQYLKIGQSKTEVILLGNKEYRYLPLNPTYYAEKDKWIAVLGFENIEVLEDPYVELVFARYQKNSIDLEGESENTKALHMSEFTQPHFINILSDRYVNVERNGERPELIIEVKNMQLQGAFSQNIFLGCLLTDNHGELYSSNDISSSGFQVLSVVGSKVVNKMTYTPNTHKSILIIEMQYFDNINIDNLKKDLETGAIDVLNHPSIKIIFIKKIELNFK